MRDETEYVGPIQLKDSVSGLGPGLFNCTYALLAIGFNALLFFFINPETDYLFLTIVNILAAISFHLLILAQKRYKFKHSINNYELESLLTKVKDRLEISRKIELWSIDDDEFVLAHTTNLLFSSIIMSNSVITRLIENPVFGEIIIADEALRIENGPRKFSFVSDFMHYSLYSTGVYLFEGAIFPLLVPFGVFFLQIAIILMAIALFLLPIQQRRATATLNIDMIYGVTRLEAEKEVFGAIDRGFLPFIGSSSRRRIDESSEFRLGMIPTPLVISIICGFVTYIIFNTILSVVSEKLTFIAIPLSILFGTIGFAFSFELINPIKYETPENRSPYQNSSFEDEQTDSLSELLHELPQYLEFQVRKSKTWDGRVILVIRREQDTPYSNATLSDVVLKHLEPNEILVYSLAELKRSEVRKNQDKWLGRFIGIITLLILLSGLLAAIVFHQPIMELVILMLFLYIGLLFVIIAISTMRLGSKFQRVDVGIQKEYSSLYTILEKLQDKGNSYEMKEHKERFEYLKRYNKTRHLPNSQVSPHY